MTMKSEDVQAILDGIAARELPANVDLWSGIQKRLPGKKHLKMRRFVPRTRLGWVAMLLVVVLSGGIIVYAIDFAVRQVIQRDPGLDAAYLAKYGQVVNLTQTLGNFSVNVQWVYADANRLAIGYTATVRDEKRYNNLSPRAALTFEDGTVIRQYGGYGSAIAYTDNNTVGTNAFIDSFAQNPAKPASAQARLRFSVMLEAIDQDVIKANSTIDANGNTRTSGLIGPVVGPFRFDLTIGEAPQRTVAVAQSSEDKGIKVTLQQVRITPSQAIALLCFASPDPQIQEWSILATIDTPKQKVSPFQVLQSTSRTSTPGCYENRFTSALYDDLGDWTLTVTNLIGRYPDLPDSDPQKFYRVAGNWTFKFTVDATAKP